MWKGLKSRKALAWRALYTIWKRFGDPKWAKNLKCDLFIASVVFTSIWIRIQDTDSNWRGYIKWLSHSYEAHDTRSVIKRTHDQLRVSWQPTESLRQDESQKTGNSWTLHKTLRTICKSTYPFNGISNYLFILVNVVLYIIIQVQDTYCITTGYWLPLIHHSLSKSTYSIL
jgi:hypothetical protein